MNFLKGMKFEYRNSKIRFFLFLSLFILSGYNCYPQTIFHRHFIVALDNSQQFRDICARNAYDVQDAIGLLFNNQSLNSSWVWDPNNLWDQSISRLNLFSSDIDEITFILFNNSLIPLRSALSKNEKDISNKFNNSYFYNTNTRWSEFKNQHPSIHDYFFNCFKYSNNQSLSGIIEPVYPLILNFLNDTNYSKEYILILISSKSLEEVDGNNLVNLKNAIGTNPAQEKTLTELLKNKMEILNNSYDKKLYFEAVKDQNTSSQRKIVGYKITPKNINLGSTESIITINSDISLVEESYKSRVFKFVNLKIELPKNTTLNLNEIRLKICNISNSNLIFDDIITWNNDDGDWESNNSRNNIRLVKTKNKYIVKDLSIPFLTLNSGVRDDLKLDIELKVETSDKSINPLKYLYISNSIISNSNIKIYPFSKHAITWVVPVLFGLFLILLIVVYGKPLDIKITIHEHLDSLEIIDYKKLGRIHKPYKHWDSESERIICDCSVLFRNKQYILNWKPTVYLMIKDYVIPPGFEIYLVPDYHKGKQYAPGYSMPLKLSKGNNLNFIVCLYQNDINLRITESNIIKFVISAMIIETRLLFFKSEIRKEKEYSFYIGENLGDIWIGLDPGTTGSCIAVGSQSNNIILGTSKGYGKDATIIPSKIIFDTSLKPEELDGTVPENTYKYGFLAKSGWDIAKVKFQSIKKLLGYLDYKEIVFANGKEIKLNGKDLSSLLVKGLYKDLIQSLTSSALKDITNDGLGKSTFNPKRAVVAIPNNFTMNKIQDMVDCVRSIQQFKEVRYVYEAEAVLFYYLNNYNKYNNGNATFADENILVFDMGGATINATIVSVSKILSKDGSDLFNIDLLGKIGYGIGGDTIDYCLIKYLYSFSNEFFQLSNLTFTPDNKSNLSKTAENIKLTIVDSYLKASDRLITTEQLKDYINISLGEYKITEIKEESRLYRSFIKNSNGNYEIFNHSVFNILIYNNIEDAINEVLKLSNDVRIDRIIFSGRSIFFPKIKETVERTLSSKIKTYKKVELAEDESKTVVAQGACWYGINKNAIRLNNLKTYSSFGVKRTIGPAMTNIEYIELIKKGIQYSYKNEGINFISNQKSVTSNFALDGANVNFYQVVGKDAESILSLNQKHKFSKIATIHIPQAVTDIKMTVCENDDIECKVIIKSKDILPAKGFISDQEIKEANEEHYTWVVE